ncbi:uracil-DNA glycosylase [Consotaella aegiceratis]|uniref:uracil-DNA glycosylase n=1 Tax=Consotaella aegiceratis TaxID=3097961 RepID=UPI002F3EA64F
MTEGPEYDRSPQAAAALLAWYAEAGVDALLGETPRDRFGETAAQAQAIEGRDPTPSPAPAPRPERRAEARPEEGAAPATPSAGEPGRSSTGFPAPHVAVPDEIAVADARERARSAATLEDLRQALAGFEGCNLRNAARSMVFGDGAADAELMLIGEAPGREEDAAGEPFVGRSGQLLNRMLAAIGLERDAVRVTNTVPWRPPGNRPPTPAETEICLPFITRQIELVKPRVIACLGSPATKAILRADDGILRIRGRWMHFTYGLEAEETIPAMPMLHPAYLLRQPAQKRLAWRDLLALKNRLDELRTGTSTGS